MAVPGIGFGGFSGSRLGRGMFRGSGRMSVTFQFVPGWERNVVRESRPSAKRLIPQVQRAMAQAMAEHSRRRPGGGTEETDDGWLAGIGTPPNTHTHWHLLEFGGGFHFARAPVRNILGRLGKFKGSGKS